MIALGQLNDICELFSRLCLILQSLNALLHNCNPRTCLLWIIEGRYSVSKCIDQWVSKADSCVILTFMAKLLDAKCILNRFDCFFNWHVILLELLADSKVCFLPLVTGEDLRNLELIPFKFWVYVFNVHVYDFIVGLYTIFVVFKIGFNQWLKILPSFKWIQG